MADRRRPRIVPVDSVPTAVLQAAVVLGEGSASFAMLRHLTERLPVMIGPRWLTNRIQPIALADVVHYLARAADLAPEENRTLDIGMPDVLTYADMMRRYARAAGLRPRIVAQSTSRLRAELSCLRAPVWWSCSLARRRSMSASPARMRSW